MAHTVALCLEIALVILVRCHFDGHVLYNFESISLKSYALGRVIGEQTHLVYAEVAQHLCPQP